MATLHQHVSIDIEHAEKVQVLTDHRLFSQFVADVLRTLNTDDIERWINGDELNIVVTETANDDGS